MNERGPTLRPALSCFSDAVVLRRQLADPRRPVGERGARARAMRCTAARTEQVVTGTADEERPAPVGVVARVSDVLAGDPDRLAVHGRCAVVAPTRADREGEPLRLVAREPVVRGSTRAAGDVGPNADACD